jgi:hypothetical protein
MLRLFIGIITCLRAEPCNRSVGKLLDDNVVAGTGAGKRMGLVLDDGVEHLDANRNAFVRQQPLPQSRCAFAGRQDTAFITVRMSCNTAGSVSGRVHVGALNRSSVIATAAARSRGQSPRAPLDACVWWRTSLSAPHAATATSETGHLSSAMMRCAGERRCKSAASPPRSAQRFALELPTRRCQRLRAVRAPLLLISPTASTIPQTSSLAVPSRATQWMITPAHPASSSSSAESCFIQV